MKEESFVKLTAALSKVVGPQYVLTQPEDLSVYECDGESLDAARPDIVVLPTSTEEVQAVIELAHHYQLPVVARGAGTGLSGGATAIAGGISLVLSRMTRVLDLDPLNLTITVESGITNSSVSEAVRMYGLYYAPDPSSQIASTIGGNIAENAGGPHTLKYGTTVSHVLGIKMVLHDGTVVATGGKVRDCLGLDLLGVIIGSEGTIGIVTEATLKLTPLPQAVETILAYFPSLECGGKAVSDIIGLGIVPAAMEMMDCLALKCVEASLKIGLNTDAGALLLIELDGSTVDINLNSRIVIDQLKNNGAFSIAVAANDQERHLFWKARKAALSSLGRIAPCGYVLDGVIPRSRLAQAIAEISNLASKYQVEIANVYHAGDGNLHPCILYHAGDLGQVKRVMLAAADILTMCVRLGGTLSGEHGIGIEKVQQMPLLFSAAELQAMLNVKEVFDPHHELNPGKVLPVLKGCGESGLRPLLRHKLAVV